MINIISITNNSFIVKFLKKDRVLIMQFIQAQSQKHK